MKNKTVELDNQDCSFFQLLVFELEEHYNSDLQISGFKVKSINDDTTNKKEYTIKFTR